MKRIKNRMAAVAAAGLFACLLTACTARIEIGTNGSVEHMVIYGAVTDEDGRQRIDITRSAAFFSTGAPDGVSGAEVIVTASTGETYLFSEESPGVYLSDVAFAGVPETLYRLDVVVDWDGDGMPERFTASDRMPLPVIGEKIDLEWARKIKEHVNILAWCEMPEEQETNVCLKVRINDRIATDSLDLYAFFDEKYIRSKKIDGVEVMSLDQKNDNFRIEAGDEVALVALSITEEYDDFLRNAQKEVQPSPPMMVGPPANLPTNLVQTTGAAVPLAGYFSAYSIESVSVAVTEEFMNSRP